ncbi:MAG: EscU/YscU/HrcU family type III secretion system export apparatus switch protein [Myxococcota bacterium]|nr:EscU/YscU/HrcU family type III secretion system export apparatus switch protein [Myxococcota bacterium]
MAEQDGQEKIFDPTPQRIEKFRKEGKLAQSKDVGSAAQLYMALIAFGLLGDDLVNSLFASVRWTIEHVVRDGADTLTVSGLSLHLLGIVGPPTGFICLLLAIAAISAGFAQTKFNWTLDALVPKWEKLNPLGRISSIFGPKKMAINILLSAGKIGLGAIVIGVIFINGLPTMAKLALSPIELAQLFVYENLYVMLIATTGVLTLMAVPDYLWQRNQLMEQLKMTHEEFKRDQEEQEGKPMIKARRRAMHRELSFNRIIETVPHADVIVTNPTHLSIALRYRPGEDRAPMVIAKGADAMAMQIRAVARRHGVPIIENRPLARTIWTKVKVGKAIPNHLFQAVAEILAKVYRIRRQAS